jgi:hypothetical protein
MGWHGAPVGKTASSHQVFLVQRPTRFPILRRIGPKDIAHHSRVAGLAEPIELSTRQCPCPQERRKVGAGWPRRTFCRSSIVSNSGERPPCAQKNCLFTTAARGMAWKARTDALYTSSEYFFWPAMQCKGSRSFHLRREKGTESGAHSSRKVK